MQLDKANALPGCMPHCSRRSQPKCADFLAVLLAGCHMLCSSACFHSTQEAGLQISMPSDVVLDAVTPTHFCLAVSGLHSQSATGKSTVPFAIPYTGSAVGQHITFPYSLSGLLAGLSPPGQVQCGIPWVVKSLVSREDFRYATTLANMTFAKQA
eukprot:359619-Chlamydomonas_euryale.AAC.2